MYGSRNKQITIAIIGLTIVVTVVFIFYFEDIFKSAESEKSVAVHTLISKDARNNTIVKGQSMHFTQDALTCDDLESIKNYFTYLNSGSIRRIIGISRLFIVGSCSYSTTPRADIIVLDVEGMFIKTRRVYNEEPSIAWVIDTELIE